MSLTVSSTGAPSVQAGSQPSVAALQAQLQRYQQQLSDCVNCASAATPQGKADIQAAAARISQVQQRIAEASHAVEASRAAAAPAPLAVATAMAADAAAPLKGASGGTIDVFA